MTLTQHISLARASLPAAKTNVIDQATIELLINNAVDDINSLALCLPTSKKFNVVAEQSTYSLSSVISNFLSMRKEGLWWNNGSKWNQLDPATIKSEDEENRPNWRDLDSGNPEEYVVDGDNLILMRTPDTSLTEGFWLYYFAIATRMTVGSQYPFSGSTTELTHLRMFDESIQKYLRWKISPMIGKDSQGNEIDITEVSYKREVFEKIGLLKRRHDISAAYNNQMDLDV